MAEIVAPPPLAAASALAQAIGARVHVDVTIPGAGVRGRMRLLDRRESFSVTADARAMFADKDISLEPGNLSSPGVLDEWNCEVAVRHIAIAVRDPKDESQPLASLDDWRKLTDDQIAALWQDYLDLRERLDPLGALQPLGETELAAIRSAVKKKDADLLRAFGSSALATFLLTTAEPQSS